jgi:hypothetical protein
MVVTKFVTMVAVVITLLRKTAQLLDKVVVMELVLMLVMMKVIVEPVEMCVPLDKVAVMELV